MESKEKITFSIDSRTPDTLPMSRLAEYLSALSTLYGSDEYFHFDMVDNGSALLQVWVDEPAMTTVMTQLASVGAGTAAAPIHKAYNQLDCLLREDNAVGAVHVHGGVVLAFPGRNRKIVETVSITKLTTIDGTVIKIGVRDSSIPVTLKDLEGQVVRCQIRGVANAKRLSRHYLEAPIRVHGSGRWTRGQDGKWILDILDIDSWEILDQSSPEGLLSVLASPDNGWAQMSNPQAEWRKLRGLD
ncbi:hypothetical protein CR152_10300 [Massilia violaceinigra]|uniref:Uncharacterized protein n=1 Tax=Massilia violaceinigra TaxID=2045208 RepID=A0A2D2DIQ5_9BURK|nr:hypothetical protein [Massilia violaceinigra]ATQ74870.1 hypothetical protein CR152_10300 [Massilia violaceinigra]